MTFLEILSLLLLTGGLLFTPYLLQHNWHKAYGAALVATVVLHLFIDGYRWQMVPAYLLMVFLGWRFWRGRRAKGALWLRISGGSLLGMGLLLAWALPILLPIFILPEPTGTYAVGTQWLHLTDSSREEITTANPVDKRELMVKLWYPASTMEGKAAEAYLSEAERLGLVLRNGLPGFATSHLKKIRTHAYPDAPNAEESFPVLVFSHGYESAAGMHYAMLEEIASHAYIVAHVYHTHENIATTFPDGRTIVVNDSFAAANNWTPKEQEITKKFWDGIHQAKTDEERAAAAIEWGRTGMGTVITRRWATDLSFVLDELERLNRNDKSPFYNKLLVEQAGVFGFSIGGGAAGQVLTQDQRFVAGVNWDGNCFGDMIDSTLQQPFMQLSADREGQILNVNPIFCRNKSKKEFYYTYIKGTGHGNFSDAAYWLRFPEISEELGGIDPDRSVAIINQLSLAFFDHHIKGKPNQVQVVSKKYAEVKTDVYEDQEQIQLTVK